MTASEEIDRLQRVGGGSSEFQKAAAEFGGGVEGQLAANTGRSLLRFNLMISRHPHVPPCSVPRPLVLFQAA
jgi:hypothetical protein